MLSHYTNKHLSRDTPATSTQAHRSRADAVTLPQNIALLNTKATATSPWPYLQHASAHHHLAERHVWQAVSVVVAAINLHRNILTINL